MALTHQRVLNTASACEALCSEAGALLAKIDRFLEYNSDQAIDWGAGSTPAYITEDQHGNIDGKLYTRQAVSNAVGSLDQLRRLLTNQSVSQGDHLGNLNHLAQPMPIR